MSACDAWQEPQQREVYTMKNETEGRKAGVRTAEIARKTAETDILVRLDLDRRTS